MRRLFVPAVLVALAAGAASAEQVAVYRAVGRDIHLFDQYDNDGYSLAVSPSPDGSLELRVRVSDLPLKSRSPFPKDLPRRGSLPRSPERDALARKLTAGCSTQVEAVERILLGIASLVRYDPDRLRRQDPAAVLSSGRAYCVGFAELAVDLLRRVGIRARSVQGILRTDPEGDGYDPRIGGSYHRWIEVYYPDRGFVFSDPWASINGVDARYIAFASRALARPEALELSQIGLSGELAYRLLRAGRAALRARPVQ